ncbi:DctP family TRAP transporter solute-binding subunit [Bacillus sp. FJAT-52991]|uniref:DctP family TRAP transporter solute-binding subunit n=1 Tax=Bacillus kandeliae TaxID=3129297 RepID=A0ABZ2N8I7_9BACI
MKKLYALLIVSTIFVLAFFLIKEQLTIQHPLVYDDEQQELDQIITIRFSHVVAENTPKGLAAQRFAELVHKKSKGRIQVEVYQNGILYDDDTELDAVKNGKVEMIAPSYSKLTDIVPQWKVLDLPFLFRNDEHVQAVLTGDTGTKLLKMLDDEEMLGLSFWSNGFKQMTSSTKPLMEPKDFEKQTFRTMPGQMIEEQFRLLHARTVSMPFNEVYRSLEMQQIDGQENTISNIYSKRLYQVQKHMTISNHGYLGYVVIVNKDFWDDLPTDMKNIITEALQETTAWNMDMAKKMNETQLQDIRHSSPIKIYELTDQEKQQWKKVFKPLYEQIEQTPSKQLMKEIQEIR